MDNIALAVNVIETNEDLLGDALDDMQWDAAVLIALDEVEEVASKHLEHHANV